MVSILLTAWEVFPFPHQTFSELRYEKEDSFQFFWQRKTHSGQTETDINISSCVVGSCLPFLAGFSVALFQPYSSWKANLQAPKERKAWRRSEAWMSLPAKPCLVLSPWVGLGVSPLVYSALIEQLICLVLQHFAGGSRRCWYLREAIHTQQAWDTGHAYAA